MNSSDTERTRQLAALARFEKGCAQFCRLVRTDEEHCGVLMRYAETAILECFPREPDEGFAELRSDEDCVWGRAGCNPDDSQFEQDFKVLRELLRFHLDVRDDESRASVSVPIAAYIFCLCLSHYNHPGQRPPGPRRCDPGIELIEVQDIALAVFVEAHQWDLTRVAAGFRKARDELKWFPADRIIDMESEFLKRLLNRTALAEEIFLRWVQQHDGLI